MDTSTTFDIYYALSESWLRQVAPLCAAAGVKLHADPGFSTAADTVVCELATFSKVTQTHPRGRIFLVGENSQAQELFAAATGTRAHVVLLPEAGSWLVAQLMGPCAQTKGRVTIFAGAVGGAGCSTAAVLAGFQQAQRGQRVLVIDGTARPTPHVGSSHYLPVPLTCQGQWDVVLPDEELPAISRLKDFLPHKTYDDGGGLFWLGAAYGPQSLSAEKLSHVVGLSAQMFQHVVVDVGDPFRAAQVRGDRHVLVSPISERGDAACYHLHKDFPQWELLLNGAATAGWSPERFVQLAPHQVLGRIKPFSLGPENLPKIALRKDVPDFAGATKRPRRARVQPQPQVTARSGQQVQSLQEAPAWVPQLPSRSLFQQWLHRVGMGNA